MASTIPVILSGGAGTRLWPLSRPSTPKQLQSLLGPETMLQSTLARVNHLDGRMVIVANVNSLDAVAAQIRPDLPRLLIGEPVGRNTAPAVAAAALSASPDDVLLILPADHHIANVPAFHLALDSAVEAARQGRLVTFGVVPTRPETGFGYIVPAPSGVRRISIGGGPGALPVQRFVEKPSISVAAELIASGALWNSGMFVFPVGVLIEELSRYAPEVLARVEESLRSSVSVADRIELGPEFGSAPANSIDVAVMEPTDRAAVVELDASWNDVGSWESLWELGEHDQQGNVNVGDVISLDAADNYLRSEGPLVAAIGVEGLVVVATRDAVLIVPRDRAQDVKTLVERLGDRTQGSV
jgi:mannose-1-phosphate guanylyltransferase/mannose-6-phosphate isomerase